MHLKIMRRARWRMSARILCDAGSTRLQVAVGRSATLVRRSAALGAPRFPWTARPHADQERGALCLLQSQVLIFFRWAQHDQWLQQKIVSVMTLYIIHLRAVVAHSASSHQSVHCQSPLTGVILHERTSTCSCASMIPLIVTRAPTHRTRSCTADIIWCATNFGD
jgi:hypothetical protein